MISRKSFYRLFLSYFTDNLSKGFDSGLLTGMILIDLQKALLGFSLEVIDWYKSLAIQLEIPC